MMQEPKYDFQNGRVINRASSEVIPEDEPVFIFRARDIFAADALRNYAMSLPDDDNRKAVLARVAHFEKFRETNPERMKTPDTDTSAGGWYD